MSSFTYDALFLGVYSDLDPDETDWDVENAASLVGTTFGNSSSPIYQSIERLTVSDADSDGAANENDMGQAADSFTVNGASSNIDSALSYDVTITYADQTTATVAMIMAQDESGRLFLLPPPTGAGNSVLDDGPIESIRLDAITGGSTDAYGIFSDRQDGVFLVCFLEGTYLATPFGARRIETLREGDWVETLDHGPRKLIWVGQTTVPAWSKNCPVSIDVGALGAGLPHRPLHVSRHHRILASSAIAMRMFGSEQVLLPAMELEPMKGISRATVEDPMRMLGYWHIMLEDHSIVFAEGAPVESFLPTDLSLKCVPDGAEVWRAHLSSSASKHGGVEGRAKPARNCIQGRRARSFIKRLVRNGRYLLETGRFECTARELDIAWQDASGREIVGCRP